MGMMIKAAKLNFFLGFLPFNMRAYNNHLVKTTNSIESVRTRKYRQIPHVARFLESDSIQTNKLRTLPPSTDSWVGWGKGVGG